MTLSLLSISLLTALFVVRTSRTAGALKATRVRASLLSAVCCALCAAGVSAQTTYRDPGGAFTVSVPAGWKAEKEPDSNQVTLTKGEVAVAVQVNTIGDGPMPKPREVLDMIEKDMRQDPCTEVSHRGNTVVAGEPGEYFLITCTVSGHGDMGDTVAVAVANGKVMIVTTTSVPAQFQAAMADIQTITKSFRLNGSGPDAPRREPSNPPVPNRGNDGNEGPGAGPNAQKLKALEEACALGVMPPSECDAKRAALMGGDSANPPNAGGNSAQLQALEGLCRTGLYTADQCAAKRVALTGGGGNPGPDGENGPRPTGYENNPAGNGEKIYKDPQGAFSLTIPRGWSAKEESGCYGPPESCPKGANGVSLMQGPNWVFVAPYSAKVNELKDVVMGVAGDYQSGYKNFNMSQSDQKEINGVNVAFATFTGIAPDGTPVSMIIAGVAAQNGRYFVVATSIPQNAPQSASDDLDTMVNSLRFGGR